MHILLPMLCYNSLDIIPYTIKYYQKEDIDIFVLDNYSTDGSWEYLQDNNIPSKRVDTNNCFDLNQLLHYKEEIIHQKKPDWIIVSGSDDFILTPTPMIDFIQNINNNGFDIIEIPLIRFLNTGEIKKNFSDPRDIFFYYEQYEPMKVIHSYKKFDNYFADTPIMNSDHMIIQPSNCLFIDYGNTRGFEKREEEYKRRKLAWKRGLPEHFGSHFKNASERNWIWDKKDLSDIRKSEYWNIINNK